MPLPLSDYAKTKLADCIELGSCEQCGGDYERTDTTSWRCVGCGQIVALWG